jgi:2-oxoglutarate dehydrogenase E2 component (dihydrolipoamide succinyltransferase)
VPAPQAGVIQSLSVSEGDVVTTDQLVALIDTEAARPAEAGASAPVAPAANASADELALTPAARRAAQALAVDTRGMPGSGKDGRITKADVVAGAAQAPTAEAAAPVASIVPGEKRRVPMSRLRQTIANRLLNAQHESALLTTFNEVNMQAVMDLRKRYKADFEAKHDTRLGFMSFFTKAVVEALKRFPAVNAAVDGTDIIYHDYCDIGIAIGSPRGLVVPVLRRAEQMSMAEIEKQIRAYAKKAETGKISIEEMMGGTFTITNGGTFGSMLSTPIINPPQSAILGMHNIVERPIVEQGEIVIRPIMYLALSYDHRVIDGRESVQFLVTLKEMLEDPSRLLLEV